MSDAIASDYTTLEAFNEGAVRALAGDTLFSLQERTVLINGGAGEIGRWLAGSRWPQEDGGGSRW